ncbi:unnamed protein product [Prunus brigantina]
MQSLKKGWMQSMEKYLNLAKEIANELAAAGYPLEDCDYVGHVLRGLPSHYDDFVAWMRAGGDIAVTREELHGLLLQESRRRTQLEFIVQPLLIVGITVIIALFRPACINCPLAFKVNAYLMRQCGLAQWKRALTLKNGLDFCCSCCFCLALPLLPVTKWIMKLSCPFPWLSRYVSSPQPLNWSASVDCCSWEGISCHQDDGHQRIVGLWLPGRG